MSHFKRFVYLSLGVALLALLAVFLAPAPATSHAQGGAIMLRLEEAVTGELSAAAPNVIYGFNAIESQRVAVVFDVTAGDMQLSAVVLDQDLETVLAETSGPSANGVVARLPGQGLYYIRLTGSGGASASYRLMINASPILPINAFVSQAYLVAGVATTCEENTPAARFTPTEDLNVCFVMELIDDPVELKVEWWAPSGGIATEESTTLDVSLNGTPLLSGIVYQDAPLEEGWWQVHFLIGGELAYIQWVPVTGS